MVSLVIAKILILRKLRKISSQSAVQLAAGIVESISAIRVKVSGFPWRDT
ncbi:MAG: hypothetical protein ABL925_13685 [Methylococcales bacterium]